METLHKRELASLSDVFRVAEEFFDVNAVPMGVRSVIEMALEELFTNLVKYNRDSNGQIKLDLNVEDNRVVATFTDFDTNRFDPTEAPEVDVGRPLDERTPGGLGIHLIKRMLDGMEYDYRDRIAKTTIYKRMS